MALLVLPEFTIVGGWSNRGLRITKSSGDEVPEHLFEKLRGDHLGDLITAEGLLSLRI